MVWYRLSTNKSLAAVSFRPLPETETPNQTNETMSDIALNVKKNQPKAPRQKRPYIDYTRLAIEKGIPLKPRTTGPDGQPSKMQLFITKMEVGDSFLIPCTSSGGTASMMRKVFGKGSFATRKIDLEFTRVWRIK